MIFCRVYVLHPPDPLCCCAVFTGWHDRAVGKVRNPASLQGPPGVKLAVVNMLSCCA